MKKEQVEKETSPPLHPNAKHTHVILVVQNGDSWYFGCQADDLDHAIEQAINAYPHATIDASYCRVDQTRFACMTTSRIKGS